MKNYASLLDCLGLNPLNRVYFAFGTPPFTAHYDGGGAYSMMGAVGTLGTADAGGTAQILPIAVDPATGAQYVELLSGSITAASNPTSGTLTQIGTVLGIGGTVTVSGASAGTNVNIVTGTQNTLGTVAVVNNLVTGTIASITNLVSGTLLNSGTTTGVGVVTTITGIGAGTQNTLGTVGVVNNIVTGTIAAVTSVTNLAAGTVTSLLSLSAGTLNTLGTVGVVNNIVTGTLAAITSVTNLAAGTVTSLLSQSAGTLNTLGTVGVVNSIGAGTQNTLGTVGVVNSIAAGTFNTLGTVAVVNSVAAGSIQINQKPAGSAMLTYGTMGTAGAATWGTIIAPAGAGTYVYVSGLSAIVYSGTVDVAITTNVAGSQGAGVLARGQFVPNTGIMRDFSIPISVGTNGTIAYLLNGAGTAYFQVNYWVGT